MPAGRNQVAYDDIRYDALTYKVDGITLFYDRTKPNGIGRAAGTGPWVMLVNDDTVALTNAGSNVQGKVLKIESDNFCSVQDRGMVTGPKGDGAAARGQKVVGDVRGAARGYVRDVDAAVPAEVEVARGQVINVADADNIVVDLG